MAVNYQPGFIYEILGDLDIDSDYDISRPIKKKDSQGQPEAWVRFFTDIFDPNLNTKIQADPEAFLADPFSYTIRQQGLRELSRIATYGINAPPFTFVMADYENTPHLWQVTDHVEGPRMDVWLKSRQVPKEVKLRKSGELILKLSQYFRDTVLAVGKLDGGAVLGDIYTPANYLMSDGEPVLIDTDALTIEEPPLIREHVDVVYHTLGEQYPILEDNSGQSEAVKTKVMADMKDIEDFLEGSEEAVIAPDVWELWCQTPGA